MDNEINYNPAADFGQSDTEYEFIELYNNSSDNVSLTGWNLTATNIDFTFDEFTLEAGGYVVLARTPQTYEGSIGHGGTSLINNGETLTLTDANGDIVDIVTYVSCWVCYGCSLDHSYCGPHRSSTNYRVWF